MSATYISPNLRKRVSAGAGYRCGYCHCLEAVVGAPMEIDHLIPESQGGLTDEQNLWLACSPCNDCKSNRLLAVDPVSGKLVRLFDPRRQVWREHFQWADSGDLILGLTPIGRATIVALNMNRASIVKARQLWVSVGWHPPADDLSSSQSDADLGSSSTMEGKPSETGGV